MQCKFYRFITACILVIGFAGCQDFRKAPALFQKVDTGHSGITFSNIITTSDTANYSNDAFIYNGAGVAAGDINRDGLPDLFFAGNMVPSRLYLNQGNFQFSDITQSSGITIDQWATGVSMVDINGDRWIDIYVSVSGREWSKSGERKNLLYLNNGDNTFDEVADSYGISDDGFTTHSVFFDYNNDGFLDLYVLNNSPSEFARGLTGQEPESSHLPNESGIDRLYRNNGDGTFSDVSKEAGILQKIGYGLGAVVNDLNHDGWPDIYISNDITPNDVLYINNGDGTFSDKSGAWLRHTSYSGMGIDIADFNNDGWDDIIQTDMVPQDLQQRKRMTGTPTFRSFSELQQKGLHPQYNQNTLQLNLGKAPSGDLIFSEIARMAGVAYSDWSWSTLFADYDNDGAKDLFITNGYPIAAIDYDFQTMMYRARSNRDRQAAQRQVMKILKDASTYKVSNYVFKNESDLTFSDKTEQWGLDQPGYSYGAAYADLNNDGSLDLIVNNINEAAFIYKNTAAAASNKNHLKIQLEGEAPNTGGLGSKIILSTGSQKQYFYHTPYRGYMSTMDNRIHIGLGDAKKVDSLQVIWPDGSHQLMTDIKANQTIALRQVEAEDEETRSSALFAVPEDTYFTPANKTAGLSYLHKENMPSEDYKLQPLLPYEVSRQGPPLAAGDVTGNGLDDIFVGGDAGFPGKLYLQDSDGQFFESPFSEPWESDKNYEDWGAHLFDANGDGLLDLYVASGGYHLSPLSKFLQDRIYINLGNGKFEKSTTSLPKIRTSTASVVSTDFTGDGLPDLFVGGRIMPANYPHPTRSYLLRNEGGHFSDITEQVLSELTDKGGMVTDAVWMDFNHDGKQDLVTAGIWMPVQFFQNDGERFHNVTESMGLPAMTGWWFSLQKGDLNSDGHMDLVAGNLGLNYSYRTSSESKFGLYAADFSRNRTTDIIFTKEINGVEYPYSGLEPLGRLIYDIGLRYDTFESFAQAPIKEIFNPSLLDNALHYQADSFASSYFMNNGDGTFSKHDLPNLAQIAPVEAIIIHDIDGDSLTDILLAGNLYHAELNTPRADAGNGLWLRGDAGGNFESVSPAESGFIAPGDVRDMALIRTPVGKSVVISNNSDSLQVFVISPRN